MRKAPSRTPYSEIYGTDPKKVKTVPKDYKKLDTRDGKTFYKSHVPLEEAKNSGTLGSPDDAAYNKFLQDKLASGVTPEQLVEGKYISPNAIEKYRSYYKPSIVFTETEQLEPAKPTTIPLEKNPVIDRKLINTGNSDYLTYDYPDVNAGYSKATTKYFDPNSQKEIDPLKSYSSGSYKPFYLSDTSGIDSGTLKNNVPTISDRPIVNDEYDAKPALSMGFKKGGKVKGYNYGTTNNGVVPASNLVTQSQGPSIQTNNNYQSAINAANARKELERQQKKQKRDNQIRGGANAAGRALGSYGTAYYASEPQENESEQTRAAAMAAVSQAGPIGGVIGGLAAIGDKIGKPIKERSERTDEQGNLIDPKAAKRNATIGGLLSPSKAWATRNEMNKAGFKGNTLNPFKFGSEYNAYLEKQAKDKIKSDIDEYNAGVKEEMKLSNENRLASAIMAREMGDTTFDSGVYEGDKLKEYPTGIDDGNGRSSKAQMLMDKAAEQRRNGTTSSGGGALGGMLRRMGALKRAEGGMITGKGTAKSDSIKAKVEEGSFIVPAENAHIAKELKEKVLRKVPTKKAHLNQGGGVDVMLSNGEYMFTPQEKAELEAEGIDLTKLAPNAKDDLVNHLKCGGKIKGYAKGTPEYGVVDPKKELAKLKAQNKSDIEARNKAQKEAANARKVERQRLSKESDIRRAKAEYERLSDGIRQLNDEYQVLLDKEKDKSKRAFGESDERINDYKIKLLEKMSKLQDDADATRASYDPNFTSGSLEPSTSQYTASDFDFSNNYGLTPNKTKDLVSDAEVNDLINQVNAQEADKTIRKAPSKGGSATKKVAASDFTYNPSDYSEGPESVPASKEVSLGEATSASPANTPLPTTQSGQLNQSAAITEDNGKSFDWAGLADNVVGYGLPAVQTALGFKKLKELGKRPVDKLDPAYQAAISQSQRDVQKARELARFGYTGEEMAAINTENAGLTNAGRAFARNIAAGNAAQGLATERAVLGDAYGRKLQSRISDNALKMQKQEQAMQRQSELNSMLAHNQELQRRLFTDTLNAWNTDQAGAGQLVNAGLSNALDTVKYNKFKKQLDEANKKYQF